MVQLCIIYIQYAADNSGKRIMTKTAREILTAKRDFNFQEKIIGNITISAFII